MNKRWVVTLSLAAVLLLGLPGVARQAIDLSGEWECIYGDAKTPPAPDAAWTSIPVPATLQWRPEGPHTLWYRTRFYLPPAWAGRRIILTINGAKHSQRVLFNGAEVGQHVGGFEPVEYDLSKHVLLGSANELLVAVQDWTALIASGARVGAVDPTREFGAWVKDGLIAPIGARGWETGIWGDVSVDARPRVWIDSVFVAPSVRQQTLRVHVTLKNASVTPERTIVTARIATGGGGPPFAPQLVTTAPGELKTVTLEALWPEARLWTPHDPHLYSVIAGARTGAIGDSVEATFGFREFWIEGDRFYLNDVPMNLLATATLPMPEYDADPARAYEAALSTGCVAMALTGQPYPQQWYDAADKAGMLLISESALWRLAPSYALGRDEFWKNASDHLGAMVKSQRNHPSVVIWAAVNELLYSGGSLVKGVEQKVAAFADTVRKADATRPVMFEGDADPAGKADIVNLHYPRELSRSDLWPQAAYWFDAPVKLDNYPGGMWQWNHAKPLYLGAFGRIPAGDVNAASVLLGDTAYPDIDAAADRADAWMWMMQIAAARDAGVSGIAPWSIWESADFPSPLTQAQTAAYRPIAAYTRETGAHAFAGTVVDRTIMAFNDTSAPATLDVRWRLAPADRKWEAAESRRITLEPAGRGRMAARLALPPLSADVTRATFTIEVWEGSQQIFASSQDWWLFGREHLAGAVPGAPAEVAIFDPLGETTERLSELGIKCLALDAENARRYLHFTPLAIVGKGAFGKGGVTEPKVITELGDFVRGGGSLLVFEQERYPADLIPTSLTGRDSTIAFLRYVGHPALAGIEAADLVDWLPSGPLGSNEMRKPDRVGFLPIVDSGGDAGLATAGLSELRVGDGRVVLCQFDVTATIGVDPVATRLFRNLLAYGTTRPARAARTAAFATDEQAAALDTVGLQYDRLAWPLAKGALRPYDTLLICNLDAGISEPARVQEFVRDGGRVLLHHVTPDQADLVRGLTGQPFQPVEMVDGWVLLQDRTGPAAGLSNQEFAWFAPASPTGNATPALTADIAAYALRQASDIAMPLRPPPLGPTYHAVPGVLVSSRLGRGIFVLDQVNWERPGVGESNARRYLATLLTNLGCAAKR